MVDVTGKDATKRTAVAAGTFHTTADVVALIASGGLPKGDAVATARIAGILAANFSLFENPATVVGGGAHDIVGEAPRTEVS